jgi:hypothetical protein
MCSNVVKCSTVASQILDAFVCVCVCVSVCVSRDWGISRGLGTEGVALILRRGWRSSDSSGSYLEFSV